MKRTFLALLGASVLTAAVAAQTGATTQTTGSATQQTSATAGKTGAAATNATSGAANSTTQAGKQGVTTSGAANATSQASGAANIPAGTKIPAVLSKSVDSKKAKVGDAVEAKTVADVVSQGKVIIPRNSKLLGHVTQAEAKGSGAAESRLGLVFDQIQTKKGQTMPLTANIQAIGAAVVNHAASMGDTGMESTGSMGGGGTASGSAGGGSGGGVLGGATGAVGSVAGSAGQVAGSAGDTVGSTVGGAGSTVGSTVGAATSGTVNAAGNSVGLNGALTNNSTGVVGLKGLSLSSGTDANASGSVVTSTGKSVKLDSGSQLVLNANGTTGSSTTKQ